MRGWLAATVVLWASVLGAQAPSSESTDGWDSLAVPGGVATLRALGINESTDRAAVMIELIRRLHFSTQLPNPLAAAIKKVPVDGPVTLTLPLPLSPATWDKAIFGRAVPRSSLFSAILNDVPARLLFHGVAGLDGETRRWIDGQPALLRDLYRNTEAAKAFAVFAPAIRIANGRVLVPGGVTGAASWTQALGVGPERADAFVSRLFLDREGRAAGLYFLIAFAEEPRQKFLLGQGEDLTRLLAGFSSCYPRQSNDYPFVMRSKDPAWLLQHINLTDQGLLAGPRSRALWEAVFSGNELTSSYGSDSSQEIDAAWLVNRLCAASSVDRSTVFATLLAGHRLFVDPKANGGAEFVLAALRVRRLFPALFMALEHAGVSQASTFSYAGRMASKLDRLNDVRDAPIALRQFQGAVALVLGAASAGTLTDVTLRSLLSSIPELPSGSERYEGRMAGWIERQLLVTLKTALNLPANDPMTAEDLITRALAGPAQPRAVRWEEIDYVLDYSRSTRDRLRAVRAKQGGDTLDGALRLEEAATNASAVRAADAVLAQVLASWAYAPHLGAAGGGALVGGDASVRHDLGIRQINRTIFAQRWELAIAPGDRGTIAGSYFGLEAALAGWSLLRLSADTIPSPPTVADNDRMSLLAAVSLSDPRALSDEEMHRIAAAMAQGTKQLSDALGDAKQLDQLAERGAISPWRRAALPWMLAQEPKRIAEQFSPTTRARLGSATSVATPAWGASAVPLGCLCLMATASRIPELAIGRPVDGIVGAQSGDLMFRMAELLTELKMPAPLLPAVSAYAMRDFIDGVRPTYPADADAFPRQAAKLTRIAVEDYLGAIAAIGPLYPR